MTTTDPLLTLDEAKAIVATKTAPKVTEEGIKAKIARVEYHAGPPYAEGGVPIGTMCYITMRNGFVVFGYSAPASPQNFDGNVGERYAYDNAFKQLWPLEGYLLRERLHYADEVTKRLDEMASQRAEREADAREA